MTCASIGWAMVASTIGILRERDRVERQETRDGGDNGDDAGEAGSVNEDRRQHRSNPVAALRQRASAHRHPRTQILQAFDDHLRARLIPLFVAKQRSRQSSKRVVLDSPRVVHGPVPLRFALHDEEHKRD